MVNVMFATSAYSFLYICNHNLILKTICFMRFYHPFIRQTAALALVHTTQICRLFFCNRVILQLHEFFDACLFVCTNINQILA